jgi:hypothetical protein
MAKGILIGLVLSTLMWTVIGASVYAVLKPSPEVHLAAHTIPSG